MTHDQVSEIVAQLRAAELAEFTEVAKTAMPSPGDIVTFPTSLAPYVVMMIFHIDDEIKEGRLVSITRLVDDVSESVNPANDPSFMFEWVDDNGVVSREYADQALVGTLSKVTEAMTDARKQSVSDQMLANYKELSETEKLFLSEIVGDEQWIAENPHLLPSIFSGMTAPNGDRWENAPFAKTQKSIRDKVAKGTQYE